MTNQNNVNKPILTLNMNEKIYLAVDKYVSKPLSFVYTLACLKHANTNQYDISATPEIHTFDNEKSAAVYHDTIEQIILFNLADKNKESLFHANEQLINNFRQNVR